MRNPDPSLARALGPVDPIISRFNPMALALPVFQDPPAPAAPATQAAPAAPAQVDPAPPAPAGKTVLDSPPGDGAVTTPADWPADWRDRMATVDGKVDKKIADRLGRYTDPMAAMRAGIEAQNRIMAGRAGEDVPMPDAEKDPEGAKKWREERGIPADPTGYDLGKLADKLTDADKPVLATYMEYAHSKGMSPAEVQRNVEWYTNLTEAQAQAQEQVDRQMAQETEETLRKQWGDSFRDNRQMAAKFGTEAIPGVDWFTARLPDGRSLGNIPEVVAAFAELGLLKYGDISFAGGEAAKATEGRMTELKTIMTTDIDRWNSSPQLRKEYFELLEKSQARAGARG